MKALHILITVCLSLFLGFTAMANAVEFYVAPDGNDANPGSKEQPFASLERAHAAIAALQPAGLAPGGMTVWLRGGTYLVRKSLLLDEKDSGSQNAPVVYRAFTGETVHLTGGQRLDPASFRPVTDEAVLARLDEKARGKVLQIDLRAQGVTDFGTMHERGFGYPIAPAPLELFVNNNLMTLARWPNDGYASIGSVVGDGATSTSFTVNDDRVARWATAEDPWLYGFWYWNWADMTLKLKAIDPPAHKLTLTSAPKFGMKAGGRIYALNMLEELDAPGEWYLNRKTGILYFWPPQPLDGAEIAVSVMADPFVSMRNCQYVTFRDLIFENARGPVVQIIGGSHNRLIGCTLRNLGSLGVVIGQGDGNYAVGRYRGHLYLDTAWNRNGGTDNGILACDIYNTGEGAIVMGGGDRKTLTPAGNFVENCLIAYVNRASATSMAAVMVDGVGNRVAHNFIHDGPYTGIMIAGNDHQIEYNHVYKMVTDTDDSGAFYIGRNPSERGNIVRYNFWQEIGSAQFTGTKAVYLDDGTCGVQVYGNIFYKAVNPDSPRMGAVFINGGKDNTIENNIFIDCVRAVGIYPWGQNWQNFLNGRYLDKVIPQRLHADVDISQPPYSTRYPQLANLNVNPARNTIRRNMGYRTGTIVDVGGQDVYNNWLTTDDPGFKDVQALKFQLGKSAQVFRRIPGFQDVPYGEMGMYTDEYRPTKPYLPHSADMNPKR